VEMPMVWAVEERVCAPELGLASSHGIRHIELILADAASTANRCDQCDEVGDGARMLPISLVKLHGER
jgi:hypothetical protein